MPHVTFPTTINCGGLPLEFFSIGQVQTAFGQLAGAPSDCELVNDIGGPSVPCSTAAACLGAFLAAFDEPEPPSELPCTSPTAPFVASDPVCVSLVDDVRNAVLAALPSPIAGPVGATGIQGIQGFAGPIGATGPLGPIGLTGLTGLEGTFPQPGDSAFARFLQFLGVQVGQFLASGSRSGSSLPASPATVTINRTILGPAPLERVAPGGTISDPVVRGSSADPAGVLRPRFPPPSPRRGPILLPPPRPLPGIPPAGKLPDRIPGVFHGQGLLNFLGRTIVPFLAARQRQKELLEAQRRARRRVQQSLNINVNLIGGFPMPFGQAGFMAGQDGGGGGFLGGLANLATALTPIGLGLFGPQPQQQNVGLGFGGAVLGGLARQIPGVLGGLVLGEGLEAVQSQGSMGALFRPTATRIVPVPELSMIGPDGKCHTWLHATPKGWKINRSNVSGRRRHHHHPR